MTEQMITFRFQIALTYNQWPVLYKIVLAGFRPMIVLADETLLLHDSPSGDERSAHRDCENDKT